MMPLPSSSLHTMDIYLSDLRRRAINSEQREREAAWRGETARTGREPSANQAARDIAGAGRILTLRDLTRLDANNSHI